MGVAAFVEPQKQIPRNQIEPSTYAQKIRQVGAKGILVTAFSPGPVAFLFAIPIATRSPSSALFVGGGFHY